MIINKITYHFVQLADSTALCTWHCFRSSATQNCYWHWYPVCSATRCIVGRQEHKDSRTAWSICGLLVFPVKHIELSHSTSSTDLGACALDMDIWLLHLRADTHGASEEDLEQYELLKRTPTQYTTPRTSPVASTSAVSQGAFEGMVDVDAEGHM